MFQSARQIWVWPNIRGAPGLRACFVVSICQADLGLAEHRRCALGYGHLFRFNLPGRFGFGRTGSSHHILAFCGNEVSICQADLGLAEPHESPACALECAMFQSARQIWVWPNSSWSACTFARSYRFQSARQIWVWPNTSSTVRALMIARFQSARQIWVWPNKLGTRVSLQCGWVSICQADLGLAEHAVLPFCGNNSVGFQSARQIWVWPNLKVSAPSAVNFMFQSARQIWVWPNSQHFGREHV